MSRMNSFVELPTRTIPDEFFQEVFCKNIYESDEAVQEDLNDQLERYTTTVPYQGDRNRGRCSTNSANH